MSAAQALPPGSGASVRGALHEPGVVRHPAPGRAVRRDLHRLPDRVHADRGRGDRRLRDARAAGAPPDDAAGLLGDARPDAGVGPLLPVHGLPARAIGPHGTAVSRHPARVRVRARLALPRGARDGDDLRRGDGHRRLVGDAARRDGGAGDDPLGLRHPHVGRRDHRRRHARHPDPAVGHADRDGSRGRGAGDRSVRRRRHSRTGARAALHHLHARPQLSQSGTGAGAAAGGARRIDRRSRARARLRHRAGGGRHFRHARRHSRRHRDADRRRRGRRVCRAADDASVPAHDVGEVSQGGVFDAAHVLHDPAARRRVELLRRGVLAPRQRDADRGIPVAARPAAHGDAAAHPRASSSCWAGPSNGCRSC